MMSRLVFLECGALIECMKDFSARKMEMIRVSEGLAEEVFSDFDGAGK